MSWASPDPAVLRKWGEPAVHRAGDGHVTTVKVFDADTRFLEGVGPAVHRVLFGTMKDSGFEVLPIKADIIEFDEARYRVYDVKVDRATGQADGDGLWIYLTLHD